MGTFWEQMKNQNWKNGQKWEHLGTFGTNENHLSPICSASQPLILLDSGTKEQIISKKNSIKDKNLQL